MASASPWFDFHRPSNDSCICPKCGVVLRPSEGVHPDCVYSCCGAIWTPQGRYNRPLPGEFWLKFDFGDEVPKRYRKDAEAPIFDPFSIEQDKETA
jgi:hypothetical protein